MTRYPSEEQHQQDSFQTSQSYIQPHQQQHPISAPFEFESNVAPSVQAHPPPVPHLRPLTQAELSNFIQPQPASLYPHAPPVLPASSPFGLPVYSASGFDLLSILARVASRPHPRVVLGPVDMTCSFVVVDVRRFDHPIVYCSPTFSRLTGYSESEVLGRNCRFLQAPNGLVQRGETRRYTDQGAVVHLKKNLSADKECQTSIINYKKDGTAFMNLVTVIPISGGVSGAPHEESDVVYHVGFQVDLTEQPNAILEKLRDGSYIVDYSSQRNQLPQPLSLNLHNIGHLKDRKTQVAPSATISRDLKKLLLDPAFVKSIPISSSTTVPPSQSSSARAEMDSSLSTSGSSQLLHLLLLEASPDFIHVVSLKGSFLYVAPSVRRVLGYEPEEMVGKSISDYAHPEDVVPLMRELKEGSATGLSAAMAHGTDGVGNAGSGEITAGTDQAHVHSPGIQIAPRTVDLLFRARTKIGAYVWIECKGRLHVEPGKGRKAIILSGRAKEMPKLDWHLVARGGGLSMPVPAFGGGGGRPRQVQTEVWGMISSGRGGGGVISFLVIGAAMTDVLGWSPLELVGQELGNFVADGAKALMDEIRLLDQDKDRAPKPKRVYCKMRHKDGSSVDTLFVLYRPNQGSSLAPSTEGIIRAPLIYQLRLVRPFEAPIESSVALAHSLNSDVFGELDTSRDSSWQYELQQIRFANQRLEDEISALEKQLEEAEEMQQKALNELQQNSREELGHYVQPNQSSTFYAPRRFERLSSIRHHHFLQRCEETPSLNAVGHHQCPTIAPGTFVRPLHPHPDPQSRATAPAMSLSHDWGASHIQNQTHLQGVKRSWDVVSNQ